MMNLELIKDILGIVALIAGWLWAIAQWVSGRRVTLLLDSRDGVIYLTNDSKFSIELLGASLVVTDPFIAPIHAKESTLVASIGGILTPTTRTEILKIDGHFLSAIRKTSEHLAQQAVSMGFQEVRIVRLRLYLRYKRAGTNDEKTMVFDRWLSGNDQVGYGLQYSPYYHERNAPWHKRIKTALVKGIQIARHPLQFREQLRSRRQAQFTLDLASVYRGWSAGKYTDNQLEGILKKLAKSHDKKNHDALAKKIMKDFISLREAGGHDMENGQ